MSLGTGKGFLKLYPQCPKKCCVLGDMVLADGRGLAAGGLCDGRSCRHKERSLHPPGVPARVVMLQLPGRGEAVAHYGRCGPRSRVAKSVSRSIFSMFFGVSARPPPSERAQA